MVPSIINYFHNYLCVLPPTVENITSGSKATAEVKVGGFLFENRTYDLCNTAVRRVNMKCPVAIGLYNVTVTTLVPVMSPRVSLSQATIDNRCTAWCSCSI